MAIDVVGTMNIYEVNGKDVTGKAWYEGERLEIKSHWNSSDRVVLCYGDVKITVIASDLLAAIANAQNKGRR